MSFSLAQNDFDIVPADCPRCHRAISPTLHSQSVGINEATAELVFVCPACKNLFIASYDKWGVRGYSTVFRYQRSAPVNPVTTQFTFVDRISAEFGTIYNEANAAEGHGLLGIAGLGFRKALEFLIKDYCVAKHHQQAEKIISMPLGSVIKTYLAEEQIKEAAELSAWLGNDEAHYERRHNRDISDLKTLLEIAISGIEQSVRMEVYRRELKPDQPHGLKLLSDAPRTAA